MWWSVQTRSIRIRQKVPSGTQTAVPTWRYRRPQKRSQSRVVWDSFKRAVWEEYLSWQLYFSRFVIFDWLIAVAKRSGTKISLAIVVVLSIVSPQPQLWVNYLESQQLKLQTLQTLLIIRSTCNLQNNLLIHTFSCLLHCSLCSKDPQLLRSLPDLQRRNSLPTKGAKENQSKIEMRIWNLPSFRRESNSLLHISHISPYDMLEVERWLGCATSPPSRNSA